MLEYDGFVVDDAPLASGPGRPTSDRGIQLEQAISAIAGKPGKSVKVNLAPDEMGDKFYRFTQRSRAAAERLGERVRVSKSKQDETVGVVTMLSA